MRNGGPYCPDCKHDAPASLLVKGLGKPFPCEGCGRKLMVPRGTGLSFAIVAFLAFWRFRDPQDFTWWNLTLVLGLAVLVGIASWLTMRVRRAD